MEKKALFLDFDGVLFDTLKEVYLVNRCLYSNISLFDEIDEENYALYSKYKYLVYNIWMFYYYNPLLFNKTKEEEIVEKFNTAIQNRNKLRELNFCENFLQVRADLVKNNYNFWKNLETPYEFFYNIKNFSEQIKPEIIIVSKKNKASIIERFASYNFKIDENKIFAREILDSYSTKGEFINKHMKDANITEAIFVDDNNNNLKTCDKYSNIKQILAIWGNCQPELIGYNQKEAFENIRNFFINNSTQKI